MLKQDFLRLIRATATSRANAQRFSELIQIVRAVGRSPANLFVSNGFADANVH